MPSGDKKSPANVPGFFLRSGLRSPLNFWAEKTHGFPALIPRRPFKPIACGLIYESSGSSEINSGSNLSGGFIAA
jgi:hypothetical protein